MKDSYFSRTPRITTQAQMAEVLAARSGKSYGGSGGYTSVPETPVTAAPDGSAPSPTPAALIWDEPVKHGDGSGYVLSKCGRYSVAKVKTNAEWSYEAFIRLPLPTCIERAKSALAAQEAAQRHADEHLDSGGATPDGV